MIENIIVILVCIALSAFFSGMEIAFVSSNKLHIELEKKREGFFPKILTRLTQKSSRFITTMLVGNNIALVVYSFFMGDLIIGFFQDSGLNDFSLLLLQTLISTVVILVTAEFLPKAIFQIYANQVLKIFTYPAYFFYILFYGISSLISGISDFLLKLFFNAKAESNQTEFSKEELGHYIEEQLDASGLENEVDSEIQIFRNALEFHEVKAREIMIPRTEIVAVELHEKLSFLKNEFVRTGLSKIITYKGTLDDIVGYIPAFSLFKKPSSIKSIILPVEFVPESMLIGDVLNTLVKKRKSVAVVLDEYGGTAGIITVEDIIEELFGEIEDEHDKINLIEKKLDLNHYLFSARLEVDHLNEEYQLDIPKSESYETLGGFIIENLEYIPEKDEEIELGKFQIKVVKVGSSRIDQVELQVLNSEE
ncbi:hemolysin family protein [Flavobacteriaceae bacterium]|nr:hemolysin family protein [Flavobacteriaceae bacterium]